MLRGEAEVVRLYRLASRRVLPLKALEEQYNKKALVGQTKSALKFFAGDILKDFEIFPRRFSWILIFFLVPFYDPE
jgi:hypothetical protein